MDVTPYLSEYFHASRNAVFAWLIFRQMNLSLDVQVLYVIVHRWLIKLLINICILTLQINKNNENKPRGYHRVRKRKRSPDLKNQAKPWKYGSFQTKRNFSGFPPFAFEPTLHPNSRSCAWEKTIMASKPILDLEEFVATLFLLVISQPA